MKAKQFRRERWKRKQLDKMVDQDVLANTNISPPPTKRTESKQLEDWLVYSRAGSAHRFRVRLVAADLEDAIFMQTFSESLAVYQAYQIHVHGDPPDKPSSNQYKRFLCKNPLLRDGIYGAFHRQYLLDDRIIAVGVLDILPNCVSSVYLFYDPEYSFLSLGTYTSLSEIAFVRELSKTQPMLEFYCLGFYIHSCQKMRYKGQFSPSFLCCPQTFTWEPIDRCTPLIAESPYSRLNPNPAIEDVNASSSIDMVKVLHCQKMLSWSDYKTLCQRDIPLTEDEVAEVKEYAGLVGQMVASRMLLFRPK